MTGFGRCEKTFGDKTFLVEIKSLNGKQFELNLKIPALLKPYEFDIRNLIHEVLLRGSVDCTITVKQNHAKPVVIHTDLIKSYYRQLQELSSELSIDTNSVLSALLRLPEVVVPSNEVIEAEDWPVFKEVLTAALQALDHHRTEEGAALEAELKERVRQIQSLEEQIAGLEPARKEKMVADLKKEISEMVGAENYDKNRLEQEIIYYVEKIDIREEQVRLRNHCEYFLEILNSPDAAKGKKLSFVIQEMGREINTTGSKAYDAKIQRLVVNMKDQLEKAKEQMFNVL